MLLVTTATNSIYSCSSSQAVSVRLAVASDLPTILGVSIRRIINGVSILSDVNCDLTLNGLYLPNSLIR